jgi:uncharacterized membrane protein YhaH (DUF805 family)
VENRNPYASPRARVADAADQEYGEIRIFSPNGRIGRVRYIGYTTGVAILIAIAGFAVVAGLQAIGQNGIAVAIGIVTYAAVYVTLFLLTIQRAHDFNTTGWLSLVLFLPLVPFIFWFIPGTKGENRYGPEPPPNTGGAIALACILPVIFIVGILAAIALPAYQDYAERARQAESQQQ